MSTTTDIKQGDRVKATHASGDTAEFEVVRVSPMDRLHGIWVTSGSFVLYEGDGWDFEVIEPPRPSITEQYLALKPGARFGFTHTTVEYTKIDDRFLAMHYTGNYRPVIRDWRDYDAITTADIRVVTEP